MPDDVPPGGGPEKTVRRSAAALAIGAAGVAGAWFVRRALQQDFAAYWTAGTARRLGLDPYLNQVGNAAGAAPWDGIALFRHSRFLYPPLVADLFRPLAALSYLVAKGLFTAAMLAAWIAAGLVVTDTRRARTAFFVASALFFPFYRHLERGQLDLAILLLLALAWRDRSRPWPAGAALAAAAALKPAFAGVLPVVWACGRGRAVLAALAMGGALLGVTALVDGPARLSQYLTEVLPRASLYGEGGTEKMLLPADRLPDRGDDDGTTTLGGRRYRTSIGDAPAAASLPRLLAPDTPSPAAARLPFVVAIGGLTLLARFRRSRDHTGDALLFWAAALACVVTSPAGWTMGLVVALPLAPVGVNLARTGRLSRGPAVAATIAWAALAVPAPFAGWAAVAGSVMIIALAAAAVTLRPSPEAP